MSITDSISSIGSSITDTVGSFIHDVGARTPDVLQSATEFTHDVAKEAADLGRHGLEAIGLIDAPKRRHWLPIILSLGAVLVVGFAVARTVRQRRAADNVVASAPNGVAGERPVIAVA
jgi:hypothetical protein